MCVYSGCTVVWLLCILLGEQSSMSVSHRSPVNPGLHRHWNPPIEFTHTPPLRHGDFTHSLMSTSHVWPTEENKDFKNDKDDHIFKILDKDGTLTHTYTDIHAYLASQLGRHRRSSGSPQTHDTHLYSYMVVQCRELTQSHTVHLDHTDTHRNHFNILNTL